MSFKPIGDYINLIDERNVNLEVTNLLGINITKNFMPSVANVSGTDLSKYKIIKKGQFAYSAMQVGRDKTIRLALYTFDEPAIISPAYSVIETNKERLLPEFLMMWFHRPESDRYGWFISDSSVRASLEYERLCEIQMPIPSIDEQKKYVAIYQGVLNNQQTYEKSLNDLQVICNEYLENIKKLENKKSLGSLIELVDIRNNDLQVDNLLGINVKKEFMPSKANVSSDNLSTYKMIQKKQFVYSSMQVGRDETVRVGLYNEDNSAIVSPAYQVFKVIDEKIVLSEFLMLWFYRNEFNRYGWFLSDSSVRASLEYEKFCEIQIPLPSMEQQKAIVKIYHTLETRKKINQQLKATIGPLCPVLMKGVVDNLEQEDKNG